MFFGLNKEDFAASRWRAAFPFFLLIFFSFLILVTILTETVKHQMKQAELLETENMLTQYLEIQLASRLRFAPSPPDELNRLAGLAFIRFRKGEDRLLVAAEEVPSALFKDLLHLEVGERVAWYRQPFGKKHLTWSLINRELKNGSILLAAKNSSRSFNRYQRMLRAVYFSLACGMLLGWFTALVCVKKMVSPVKGLHDELRMLIEEGQEKLLDPGNHRDEARELSAVINRLMTRNRKLVAEIQGSLDNVAHDLRTPMTRLRSIAEFGLQENSDSNRLRESLADCLEESERVLSMLRIMMSVAEAESGTIRLEKELVEIGQSLTEMVELYEYVAEEKKIVIKSDIKHGLHIEADKTRISQVWANLLDNAIKYSREGGQVSVKVDADTSGRVRVEFRDQGMGISPAEQPRIWDRLYRGDRSRSEQGLGLGLNLVKALVESHGGTVKVESELNKGSLFVVTLPLVVVERSFSGEGEVADQR